MNIRAFQGVSLNEYPGELSAMVFTQGCNFRCGYCHNPELCPEVDNDWEELIPQEEVLKKIESLREKITAVTITGGEPLLQDDLNEFIRKIKNMGLLVKLNTNGSIPTRLKHLIIYELVDYIDMDIKTHPEKYYLVQGCVDADDIRSSVCAIKQSDIKHIFTTVKDDSVATAEDIQYIGKWVGFDQYETREKI